MSKSIIRSLLKVSLESSGTSEIHFVQVKFYADGGRFLATTNEGNVYEGDIQSKTVKKIHSLKSKCTTFLITEVNGNGSYCIFGLESASVVKFNIENRSQTGSHVGVGEAAVHFDKHPWAERIIATLSYSAVIWDISQSSPLPLQRLNTFDNIQLRRATFGLNGDIILTCFVDGNIYTWDFPSLKFQYHFEAEPSLLLQALALSEDLKTLISVDQKSEFSVWDLTSLLSKQVFSLPEIRDAVAQVELTTVVNTQTSDKIFAAAVLTVTGNLCFIDLRNYSLLYKCPDKLCKNLKRFEVSNYTYALRKHLFACIFNDGTLEIWDIRHLYKKASHDIPNGVPTTTVPRSPLQAEDRLLKVLSSSKIGDEFKKGTKKTIDISELRKNLEMFGEFPSKYRAVVWRHILQLPLNKQAFSTLLNRGVHPAYSNLEERFPVTDEKLLKSFKKILSAFAHWCPLFAEVTYFPILIFPFVRTLHQNLLVCFEVIMTFLVNWCHDWFRIYPAPPFHSMAKVESFLEKYCPELLAHFTKCDVSMRVYAWPLLESSFSDVFTTDEWSRVWDHIFSSLHVEYLYATVAAYSIISQNSLLDCQNVADFKRYFHEKNPVPLDAFLQEASRLFEMVASSNTRPFVPLTEVTYPLFTDFPIAVIENHAQHMKKIREMEANYIKQKRETAILEAEYGDLHEMEAEWRRKEAMILAVEDLRHQEIVLEEQKLMEQRSRLQMQIKGLLERQMKMLESKKRALQREYLLRRKDDIIRMKDNARWMVTLRETELQDAGLEADINNYQMQMDKCLYEIKLMEDEIASKTSLQFKYSPDIAEPASSAYENSESSSEPSSSRSSFIGKEGLDERLKQLEKSNKEMENEIDNLLKNLEKMS